MTPPLPEGPFACILADPPWNFAGNSKAKPGRNARRHYPCMTLGELAALPVREVAAKDCHLFLWTTSPLLVQGLRLMSHWGFRFSSMGFVWVKLKRGSTERLFYSLEDLHFGLGLTTRKNVEYILLGKRGNPKRIAANVRDVILAPVREHSRKPDEAYESIERYCDGPRLELFPGQPRAAWTQWGTPLNLKRGIDRAAPSD